MINSKTYQEEIEKIIKMDIPFEKLDNKKVLITGATGLIGSFLVDTLMLYNKLNNKNIKIVATSFREEGIKNRFKDYIGNKNFTYFTQDITKPVTYQEEVNYIFHLASNADPRSFKTDPVGIITSNVIGVYNLLEYAKEKNVERLLYTSSGEVYGQADSSIKEFVEDYSGYVNPTNPRSCYPNSKRCAETLCVSYSEEYNINTVIARPSHVYGPTMTKKDSRVYAEFIRNVLNGEDITLKSKGDTIRSYTYVADCVSALLYIMLLGEDKEAYNIANKNSIISIKELAETIAGIGNKKVLYDIPKEVPSNDNPMKCGVLNANKLETLGWHALSDFKTGITSTINILKEANND